MEKNIFLIRHGQTELNRLSIVQGSGVDAGLNELGLRQSVAFYESYRNHPFEVVICSDLVRSHQTILPFVDNGIPLFRTALINEISWGIQEGKPSTKESISEYKSVVQDWSSGNLDSRVGGGESARELRDRCLKFKELLLLRPERDILICSHGRTMRGLNCVFGDLPITVMDKFHHSNLGLYTFKVDSGVMHPKLENDVSHLSDLSFP